MEVATPDGKVRTQVGIVDGKRLRFLAHVSHCTGDACSIESICPYKKTGRCTLLLKYLESIYNDWVHPKSGLGDVLTQIQLDRIGSHLMPLYYHLARFALEIATLEESSYQNKQGTWMSRPQFAEFRATLTQIRAEMKDLKIDAMWEKKFGGTKPAPIAGSSMNLEEILQHGRPGAYDEMVKRAQEVEGKKKKKSTGK